MAPEQVRGEPADARSDLFAFGAVLYEMLTAARAFAADSTSVLMAAILDDEPRPLGEGQPLPPPALQRLLSACLAKNPDDRWQTARDLLRELQWVRDEDAATRSGPQPGAGRTPSRRAPSSISFPIYPPVPRDGRE